MDKLNELTIRPDSTLIEALKVIDAGAVEIALVVNDSQQLLGTVTDGDIRRALLREALLDAPVSGVMNTTPQVVSVNHDRAAVLDLMRVRALSQIPVVADDGRLHGLHVLRELLGVSRRPNAAVIMAGGRGTRLGALTQTMPKPMLKVAGRPILERLVLHLVGAGIRQIYISVNYLADKITDYFQDGSDFGCSIDYLRENPEKPLGTGGSLGLIRHVGRGTPTTPLIVMNGDLVTDVDVAGLLEAHMSSESIATMAVKIYTHQVPFGVAEVDHDGSMMGLTEKPTVSWAVNAGIYVISPQLLSRVPDDIEFPLTELLEECLERNERVGVWRTSDEWEDVGQLAQLQRARGLL